MNESYEMKYDLTKTISAFDLDATFPLDGFIYFWKPDEEPGQVTQACFCQWYPSTFIVDGQVYNCAEQYMMAEKARLFKDISSWEKIIKSNDPEKIKKLGRGVKNFDPELWDKESAKVVLKGNLHKFGQNVKLLEVLFNTKHAVLAEASPIDKIWGIGMSAKEAQRLRCPHVWKGQNKLGFTLMEVRDILRKQEI